MTAPPPLSPSVPPRADRLDVAGPRVLATRSHLYPGTEGVMGWNIGTDGFGIVLTAEVPDLVHRYLGPDIRDLLAVHGLTVHDVGAWVSHPGGPKIIEAIEAELGVGPHALEMTWRSLAEVGNLSSASVLHVLRDTLRDRPPPRRQPRHADGDGARVLLRTRPAPLVVRADADRRVSPEVPTVIAYTLFVLAVGAERLVELAVSKRNLAWAFAHGGREYGRGHYPAMVLLHFALLVGCVVEVWVFDRPFLPALGWTMVAVVLATQALRWWCISTLGRRWNTLIVVIPGSAAGQSRSLPMAAAPELRRRRDRGHRAADGAHRLDHRGDVHRAQRLPAAGPDPGRGGRPDAGVPRHRRLSAGIGARQPGSMIDLLIAGAGPAGLATALYAARAGLDGHRRRSAGCDRRTGQDRSTRPAARA